MYSEINFAPFLLSLFLDNSKISMVVLFLRLYTNFSLLNLPTDKSKFLIFSVFCLFSKIKKKVSRRVFEIFFIEVKRFEGVIMFEGFGKQNISETIINNKEGELFNRFI